MPAVVGFTCPGQWHQKTTSAVSPAPPYKGHDMNDTEKKLLLLRRATKAAKKLLKKGDKIGCTRCGGIKRVYVFSHWDGCWAVSASGIDDISAGNIYSLNGKQIDFKK